MSHAFHQSEGLKVDRDGSAQSAVTQPCIHIRDWPESLSPTQADLYFFSLYGHLKIILIYPIIKSKPVFY